MSAGSFSALAFDCVALELAVELAGLFTLNLVVFVVVFQAKSDCFNVVFQAYNG